MKQNTNIFIMIGIIVLTCGQLQGLTRRQFFQLDRLKKELNVRYRGGVPEAGGSAWLDKNAEIIEQIRELDFPTVATYQKKQDMFTKKITQREVASQEETRLAEISAAEETRLAEISAKAVQPIREQGGQLEYDMTNELGKSPDDYKNVNFSKFPAVIVELEKAVLDAKNQLIPVHFDRLIVDNNHLRGMLANYIFLNLKNLIHRILVLVKEMKTYIEGLHKSESYFNFEKNSIEDPTNEIKQLFKAAFQEGLLVSNDIMKKADKDHISHSRERAEVIVRNISEVLGDFGEYIDFLNQKSQEDKDNNRLSENHFDATVQAILAMNLVINDLLSGSQRIFRNGFSLINDITNFIEQRKVILARVKTELYNIYEVKQGTGDNITILYNSPAFGVQVSAASKRSDAKKDLLVNIGPNLDQILITRVKKSSALSEKELMEQIKWEVGAGGEEPGLAKALAIQAAAMLAVVMLENLAGPGGIKEGVTEIQDAINEAVESAIKTGKSVMGAAKSAVEQVYKVVKSGKTISELLKQGLESIKKAGQEGLAKITQLDFVQGLKPNEEAILAAQRLTLIAAKETAKKAAKAAEEAVEAATEELTQGGIELAKAVAEEVKEIATAAAEKAAEGAVEADLLQEAVRAVSAEGQALATGEAEQELTEIAQKKLLDSVLALMSKNIEEAKVVAEKAVAGVAKVGAVIAEDEIKRRATEIAGQEGGQVLRELVSPEGSNWISKIMMENIGIPPLGGWNPEG